MKTLRLLGVACVLGIAATACSAANVPTGVAAGSPNQTQLSAPRGWMSPQTTPTELLYVSDSADSVIDIFSVPNYSMVGQITDGINQPEGLATDETGNLYVSNLRGKTITVYQPGRTNPSLTLAVSYRPVDVAVASNGYVYAGDLGGGIDVFPPGATSPISRLTNPALRSTASGVGVSASNDLYVTGRRHKNSGPSIVEFPDASGAGVRLGLTGLKEPAGVIVDKNDNLVVSDFRGAKILIYPPGQKSPSGTITVQGNPVRSAINKSENLIYVPETDQTVGVYDYPGGGFVTSISIEGASAFAGGAALSPAPTR